MKFEITLRRKQTLNAEQNARQLRIQEEAPNESAAKAIALLKNNNGKYFVVTHVRKL